MSRSRVRFLVAAPRFRRPVGLGGCGLSRMKGWKQGRCVKPERRRFGAWGVSRLEKANFRCWRRRMRQRRVAISGGVPEWPKGSDCKSDGSAFEGSNPSPTTSAGRGGHSSEAEPQPSKLMTRVRFPLPAPEGSGGATAHIAQQAEHFLGKEEVIGSSPIVSTNLSSRLNWAGAERNHAYSEDVKWQRSDSSEPSPM